MFLLTVNLFRHNNNKTISYTYEVFINYIPIVTTDSQDIEITVWQLVNYVKDRQFFVNIKKQDKSFLNKSS